MVRASTDEQRRNLQIEPAARVRVQREVDRTAAENRLPESASGDFIRWLPRQGDLDGRGNLSRRAQNDFVLWFLRVCQDRVLPERTARRALNDTITLGLLG